VAALNRRRLRCKTGERNAPLVLTVLTESTDFTKTGSGQTQGKFRTEKGGWRFAQVAVSGSFRANAFFDWPVDPASHLAVLRSDKLLPLLQELVGDDVQVRQFLHLSVFNDAYVRKSPNEKGVVASRSARAWAGGLSPPTLRLLHLDLNRIRVGIGTMGVLPPSCTSTARQCTP